ncbi:MAG: NADH-quinone oxidoreductase subunit C [Acidimicrobiales bacterium]
MAAGAYGVATTTVAVPTGPGQEVLHPSRAGYHDLVAKLAADGFEMVADLCAVDYLAHPGRRLPAEVAPERFEVVVNLLSLSRRRRIRLRVQVPDSDPVIDSLFDLYPGTEAMEREAYDLFGISFAGHPDLTRILLPEDWEGHPLRKDYSIARVPVQFKAAPR